MRWPRRRRSPRRRRRAAATGSQFAAQDVQPDGQLQEARLQIERQRALVVLLGVDVDAPGAARTQPPEAVVQQGASETAVLSGRRDGKPLDVTRGAGPPEESVPDRLCGRRDADV